MFRVAAFLCLHLVCSRAASSQYAQSTVYTDPHDPSQRTYTIDVEFANCMQGEEGEEMTLLLDTAIMGPVNMVVSCKPPMMIVDRVLQELIPAQTLPVSFTMCTTTNPEILTSPLSTFDSSDLVQPGTVYQPSTENTTVVGRRRLLQTGNGPSILTSALNEVSQYLLNNSYYNNRARRESLDILSVRRKRCVAEMFYHLEQVIQTPGVLQSILNKTKTKDKDELRQWLIARVYDAKAPYSNLAIEDNKLPVTDTYVLGSSLVTCQWRPWPDKNENPQETEGERCVPRGATQQMIDNTLDLDDAAFFRGVTTYAQTMLSAIRPYVVQLSVETQGTYRLKTQDFFESNDTITWCSPHSYPSHSTCPVNVWEALENTGRLQYPGHPLKCKRVGRQWILMPLKIKNTQIDKSVPVTEKPCAKVLKKKDDINYATADSEKAKLFLDLLFPSLFDTIYKQSGVDAILAVLEIYKPSINNVASSAWKDLRAQLATNYYWPNVTSTLSTEVRAARLTEFKDQVRRIIWESLKSNLVSGTYCPRSDDWEIGDDQPLNTVSEGCSSWDDALTNLEDFGYAIANLFEDSCRRVSITSTDTSASTWDLLTDAGNLLDTTKSVTALNALTDNMTQVVRLAQQQFYNETQRYNGLLSLATNIMNDRLADQVRISQLPGMTLNSLGLFQAFMSEIRNKVTSDYNAVNAQLAVTRDEILNTSIQNQEFFNYTILILDQQQRIVDEVQAQLLQLVADTHVFELNYRVAFQVLLREISGETKYRHFLRQTFAQMRQGVLTSNGLSPTPNFFGTNDYELPEDFPFGDNDRMEAVIVSTYNVVQENTTGSLGLCRHVVEYYCDTLWLVDAHLPLVDILTVLVNMVSDDCVPDPSALRDFDMVGASTSMCMGCRVIQYTSCCNINLTDASLADTFLQDATLNETLQSFEFANRSIASFHPKCVAPTSFNHSRFVTNQLRPVEFSPWLAQLCTGTLQNASSVQIVSNMSTVHDSNTGDVRLVPRRVSPTLTSCVVNAASLALEYDINGNVFTSLHTILLLMSKALDAVLDSSFVHEMRNRLLGRPPTLGFLISQFAQSSQQTTTEAAYRVAKDRLDMTGLVSDITPFSNLSTSELLALYEQEPELLSNLTLNQIFLMMNKTSAEQMDAQQQAHQLLQQPGFSSCFRSEYVNTSAHALPVSRLRFDRIESRIQAQFNTTLANDSSLALFPLINQTAITITGANVEAFRAKQGGMWHVGYLQCALTDKCTNNHRIVYDTSQAQFSRAFRSVSRKRAVDNIHLKMPELTWKQLIEALDANQSQVCDNVTQYCSPWGNGTYPNGSSPLPMFSIKDMLRQQELWFDEQDTYQNRGPMHPLMFRPSDAGVSAHLLRTSLVKYLRSSSSNANLTTDELTQLTCAKAEEEFQDMCWLLQHFTIMTNATRIYGLHNGADQADLWPQIALAPKEGTVRVTLAVSEYSIAQQLFRAPLSKCPFRAALLYSRTDLVRLQLTVLDEPLPDVGIYLYIVPDLDLSANTTTLAQCSRTEPFVARLCAQEASLIIPFTNCPLLDVTVYRIDPPTEASPLSCVSTPIVTNQTFGLIQATAASLCWSVTVPDLVAAQTDSTQHSVLQRAVETHFDADFLALSQAGANIANSLRNLTLWIFAKMAAVPTLQAQIAAPWPVTSSIQNISVYVPPPEQAYGNYSTLTNLAANLSAYEEVLRAMAEDTRKSYEAYLALLGSNSSLADAWNNRNVSFVYNTNLSDIVNASRLALQAELDAFKADNLYSMATFWANGTLNLSQAVWECFIALGNDMVNNSLSAPDYFLAKSNIAKKRLKALQSYESCLLQTCKQTSPWAVFEWFNTDLLCHQDARAIMGYWALFGFVGPMIAPIILVFATIADGIDVCTQQARSTQQDNSKLKPQDNDGTNTEKKPLLQKNAAPSKIASASATPSVLNNSFRSPTSNKLVARTSSSRTTAKWGVTQQFGDTSS